VRCSVLFGALRRTDESGEVQMGVTICAAVLGVKEVLS